MSEILAAGTLAGVLLLGITLLQEDEGKKKGKKLRINEHYNKVYEIPSREGFNDIDPTSSEKLGQTQQLTVGNFSDYAFARPNFKSVPTPRFDPYRTASGTVRDKEANFPAGAYVSSFGTQATESDPIYSQSMMDGAAEAADYTTIADMAFVDDSYQQECKKAKGIRRQYDSSLKGKSGMDGYTDPSEMLPTPNVRSCIVEDPRNPDVYMSSNTIGFKSRGGRAARSLHDHIRGDLYVDPTPILTMPMNISTSTISGGAINSGIIAEAPRVSDPQYSYGKDTQMYTQGHKYGIASGEYPISNVNQMAISGATPHTLYDNSGYLNNPWGDLQSKNV